jgi:hypothetical protein
LKGHTTLKITVATSPALALHFCLCAHSQTQVNAPHDTHRATKEYPLIHWHPQEADKAYRRPEFVSILHHGPQLIRAVARDHVHCIDTRFSLYIDIGHVAEEHERVDDGADGLVEQELDEDVGLAERRLGGVGLGAWLFGRRRGGGHVGRELVFEVALPDYVGWGAEYAEERKLEDCGIVECKGRLAACQLGTSQTGHCATAIRCLCTMIWLAQAHLKLC